MNYNLSNHPILIIGFFLIIITMIILDLKIINKNDDDIFNRKHFIWSLIWISLSMFFSLIIYFLLGIEKFAQFQSAYWVEKILSIDNLFVFILIFKFFNIKKDIQHKILFYGILGAIIMRGIFIFMGTKIIKYTFFPPIYIGSKIISINYLLISFGFFLIYIAIKSFFLEKAEFKNDKKYFNQIIKLINNFILVSNKYNGEKFFTRENGKIAGTPLLAALIIIEFTDLLFAIDSIPAIFSIAPNDSMILYTSNIFAILGLRSLYFIIVKFIDSFQKLKYALVVILLFIGIKMVINPLYHIKSIYSLLFIIITIIIFLIISFFYKKKK